MKLFQVSTIVARAEQSIGTPFVSTKTSSLPYLHRRLLGGFFTERPDGGNTHGAYVRSPPGQPATVLS